MTTKQQQRQDQEDVEGKLPPELALLLAAIRSEFEAKIGQSESRLLFRLTLMGIPLGAAGGFVAEIVKPGAAHSALSAVLSFL